MFEKTCCDVGGQAPCDQCDTNSKTDSIKPQKLVLRISRFWLSFLLEHVPGKQEDVQE